ncbi:hypothetical protein N665_0127s0008 [Sinapis alba]|nr:hypothetical protein N665_0127s0008 [Sinapis alba]
MAPILPISLLSDVRPFKNTWKIQVKPIHIWNQYSQIGGKTLEMILADETIRILYISLPLGAWRTIENFSVSAAGGKYRPTNHSYKIVFNGSYSNKGSNVKNDDNFINLTTFDTIIGGSRNTHFLIDVVGQAIEVGDIHDVQVQGKERKKLEFLLMDQKNKCNELAVTTLGDESLVISKKPKRKRDDWLSFPFRSISEIRMSNKQPLLETILIELVSTNAPMKHLWYCETCRCNVSLVEPKYKLHLMIKDETDQTKVMLLDYEAEIIVEKTVEELLDGSFEEMEDAEALPKAIKALIGKTFQLGVCVNKDNVEYGAETYLIRKAWSPNDVLCIEPKRDESERDESERGNSSQVNPFSSNNSSDQVYSIDISSDATTESWTTPKSKVKNENDMPDITSTSKTHTTKMIKLEKTSEEE